MKRILVTGGAGFIGSHTVDLLLTQGKEVVVLDNLSTGRLSYLDLFHPQIRFVQGDILDFSLLKKEMSACDAVIHLAALSSVPQSVADPIRSLKVNTLGWVNVLQAARELKNSIRLLYASSAAIYGAASELPCSEEQLLIGQALSPYALEKTNNEFYADLYARIFNIKSLGLRYFNVYGERQDPLSPYSGAIAKFIQQYRLKIPITIFGDGEQSRDFIHVSDVARANELALNSDYVGVLNIATGTAETLNNVVNYIEQAGGAPAEINYLPARLGDIPRSYASVKKACDDLRFVFSLDLKTGLRGLLSS